MESSYTQKPGSPPKMTGPEAPTKSDLYSLVEQSHCFMFLQRVKIPMMRIY